ncbi:MAG: hypothetical protein IT462_03245 [Planctomycetes bacterium]|nr:hypothetical protein [Planctomycetota bacterium]
MRKTWLMVAALAGAAWMGGTLAVAESKPDAVETAPVQWGADEKLPKFEDLKFLAGKDEGHKSPMEVVAKAIKASKDSKFDDLKSCYSKEARTRLDEQAWVNGKESTQIKLISGLLATLDAAKLKEIKQNTVGRYGVVMANSEKGTHLIRCHIAGGNWRLKDTYHEDYSRNYMTGMEDLRKAIAGGSGAEVKKYVDQYESTVLDLLAGVQDGVDPYDLLAKKLKKITDSEATPHWLLNYYSGEAALWFHTDKADTFMVVRISNEWDPKTNGYTNVVRIPINSLASFNKTPGNAFKNWVTDYDWGDPEPEDGKDGSADGSKDGK